MFSPIGDQKHDIAVESKGTGEFGEAEEEDDFLLEEIRLDKEEDEELDPGVGIDVLKNALEEYDSHLDLRQQLT